jgi:hypothetical protein
MDAYAKTTSFDSKLGATIAERRFLKSCSKGSCPHPSVRHAISMSLAARSTSFSGTVGRPSLQSFEGGSSSFNDSVEKADLGGRSSPPSPRRNLLQVPIACGLAPPFEIALVKCGR